MLQCATLCVGCHVHIMSMLLHIHAANLPAQSNKGPVCPSRQQTSGSSALTGPASSDVCPASPDICPVAQEPQSSHAEEDTHHHQAAGPSDAHQDTAPEVDPSPVIALLDDIGRDHFVPGQAQQPGESQHQQQSSRGESTEGFQATQKSAHEVCAGHIMGYETGESQRAMICLPLGHLVQASLGSACSVCELLLACCWRASLCTHASAAVLLEHGAGFVLAGAASCLVMCSVLLAYSSAASRSH